MEQKLLSLFRERRGLVARRTASRSVAHIATVVVILLFTLTSIHSAGGDEPPISLAEAEAVLAQRYSWMQCIDASEVDAFQAGTRKYHYLIRATCNYEPERAVNPYVKDTFFLFTLSTTTDKGWTLQELRTVSPESFEAIKHSYFQGIEDKRNTAIFVYTMIFYPVVVCGLLFIITLVILKVRKASLPTKAAARAFRLNIKRPKPVQPRSHWTIHQDE